METILRFTGARLWALFPSRALRAGVPDIERRPASIAALRRRRYTSSAATPGSPRTPWLRLEQSRRDVHNSRAVPARLRLTLLHRHGGLEGAREANGTAEKREEDRVRQPQCRIVARWRGKRLSPEEISRTGSVPCLRQHRSSAIKLLRERADNSLRGRARKKRKIVSRRNVQ